MRLFNSSNENESELARAFAARTPDSRANAERAMVTLIKALHNSAHPKAIPVMLGHLLTARNILKMEYAPSGNFDGLLQPLGQTYSSGFRMVLRRGLSDTRARFTIAHELCHTFFYELVPDLKFNSTERDQAEERLCDFGAAELLMPAASVRKHSRLLPACVPSLFELASQYKVSVEAMLLRLRNLGLWECELTVWHRMLGGEFLLDRRIGGQRRDYKWTDASELPRAWETKERIAGHTFVEYTDAGGVRWVKPIWFEMVRRGDSLVALWSRAKTSSVKRKLPLFELT